MANWFQRMFPNWFGFGSEKQFFNAGNWQRFGNKGPVYIDTLAPYNIFTENPSVNLVWKRKADMFSNGRFKLKLKSDGSIIDIKDQQLLKLLTNPNILQSQNEFLKQYLLQKEIYGNQYMYKSIASRLQSYPSSLTNISPAMMQAMLTGKVFDQTSMDGIIEKYRYVEMGVERFFEVDEILWSRIIDLDSPLIGVSALKSLKYPITNTKYAYDYYNVISNEKGAIGILSTGTNKDNFGAIPVNPEEKKRIQDAYLNSYGLGNDEQGRDKMRVILTELSLNWQPMSYPTRELELQVQIDTNFAVIADAAGLSNNLFNGKHSTYENTKHAMIMAYQDTIIPFANDFCGSFGKFIGVPKEYELTLDYSHVEILQDNEETKAKTIETILKSLGDAVANGLLTQQQALQLALREFGLEI